MEQGVSRPGTSSSGMNASKRMTSTGVMQVVSLRPELEFEVIKLVLLRESYIKRLQKLLCSSKEISLSITGLFEVLRETALEIVETISDWERSQRDYPLVKPFIWNGVNYCIKMCKDLDFINAFQYVNEWLRIDIDTNPFIVPPEVLDAAFLIPQGSILVFGERPTKVKGLVKKVTKKGK